MTARIADEYKIGSYVIIPVGTGGYRLNDEGYATLSVRVLKLSQRGHYLKNLTFY